MEQQKEYKALIRRLLPQILHTEPCRSLRSFPVFYFEKAKEYLQQLDEWSAAQEFYIDFLEAYALFSGGFEQWIQQLKTTNEQFYQFAKLLGHLIVYLDGKAPLKSKWNTYHDRHTVSNIHLRQNIWITQLTRYKQRENSLEAITIGAIQQAIQYLTSPTTTSSILSKKHRQQISKNLFNKKLNEENFTKDKLSFFKEFELSTTDNSNYTHLLHLILYHPEIQQCWKFEEEDTYQAELAQLVQEPTLPYQKQRTFGVAYPLNQIWYGVPGTGKTYRAIRQALAISQQTSLAFMLELEDTALEQRWKEARDNQKIAMVVFHPAFSYEDFIEGIKPVTVDGQVTYQVVDGILKRFALQAETQPEQNFVLVIDEINRGNVPQIFGELITLLEPDKRQFTSITLPYSKQSFSLPTNLYIIGTMNTSDRSTQALDTALRRRFRFQAVRPQAQLLATDVEGINLAKMLRAINQRIEQLLDNEHLIGHAYFMDVQYLEDLQTVFQYQIIPLLEHYFYQDYSKIGLILGRGFVELETDTPTQWADFPYETANENTTRYRLEPFPRPLDAYLRIYQ